jgi:hypothetical protein
MPRAQSIGRVTAGKPRPVRSDFSSAKPKPTAPSRLRKRQWPQGRSTDYAQAAADALSAQQTTKASINGISRAGEGLANEGFDPAAEIRGSARPDWPRPTGRGWPTSGAEQPAASISPKTGRQRNRRQTKGRAGRARYQPPPLHGNDWPRRDDRPRMDRHWSSQRHLPSQRLSGRDRKACCGRGTTLLSWWLKNRPPKATHESAGFAIFRASIRTPLPNEAKPARYSSHTGNAASSFPRPAPTTGAFLTLRFGMRGL